VINRTLLLMGLASLAAPAAIPASAQTPRPQMDLDTAQRMQDGCLSFARERKLKVAIAIYDYAGRLVSFAHMDGTPTAVAEVAHWKAKSAATVQISSEETGKWNLPGVPGIATVGGAVPLFDASWNALGGIGVSGASVEDDIACAKAGITASGVKQPN
jgi:glc operon protein GlcG